MSKENVTVTLSSDQVAEIYWSLVSRVNVLMKDKSDKHSRTASISERQYKRVNDTLRMVEDLIHQMNYS